MAADRNRFTITYDERYQAACHLGLARRPRHTADADVGDDRGDRGLDRRLVSHRGVADGDPRRVTSFGRRP